MSIQRWDVTYGNDWEWGTRDDGEFVKYDDHVAEVENERERRELAEAQLSTAVRDLKSTLAEVERLTAERDALGDEVVNWSIQAAEMKRDLAAARAQAGVLAEGLRNLHALIWGECPALLDDDRGGSGHLNEYVEDALAAHAALAALPTAPNGGAE